MVLDDANVYQVVEVVDYRRALLRRVADGLPLEVELPASAPPLTFLGSGYVGVNLIDTGRALLCGIRVDERTGVITAEATICVKAPPSRTRNPAQPRSP